MNSCDDNDVYAYTPKLMWRHFMPIYWGTWLTVALASIISLTPISVRYEISKYIASIAVKIRNKANKRARVNLELCFPDKSIVERETILRESYITSISFLMQFSSLTIRNSQWLERKTTVYNVDYLTDEINKGNRVILLVPHTWAIDIPAILLASRGLPVSAMAKKQKNLVLDWLMHKQRVQYGGKVYDRSVGIKPFIKSVRSGYLGYYLPDEDLGREHSVFVDFFATKKATISSLGRISKLSKAKIIPLFSMYDAKSGCYHLEFHPPLQLSISNKEEDARIMNKCIESNVTGRTHQYMWILRLLKTRPNNNDNPYK